MGCDLGFKCSFIRVGRNAQVSDGFNMGKIENSLPAQAEAVVFSFHPKFIGARLSV